MESRCSAVISEIRQEPCFPQILDSAVVRTSKPMMTFSGFGMPDRVYPVSGEDGGICREDPNSADASRSSANGSMRPCSISRSMETRESRSDRLHSR